MGTSENEKLPKKRSSSVPDGYITVSNTDLYHNLRGVVVEKKHWYTKEQWPTTDIETSHHRGIAQLRPDPNLPLSNDEQIEWREKVAKLVLKLNDLTADVLDVVCTLWLESSPRTSDAMLTLTAADFLQFRGLKKRMGQSNSFKVEQKREIAEQVALLSNLWIEVKTLSKDNDKFFRSTAITKAAEVGVEDKKGVQTIYAWQLRPGAVFLPFLMGAGRALAPLSKVALQFDPYRQKLEKRLTRYLTWIWRIRQSKGGYLQPFLVSTLLESTKTELDSKNPAKTRERFEKALDVLKESKIISSWSHTEGTDYSILGQRGWVEQWLNWKVAIEPPQSILDYYNGYFQLVVEPATTKTAAKSGVHPLVQDFREQRLKCGLTQSQLAEQLGVSGIYISQLERGVKDPSRKLELAINRWLATKNSINH